MQNIINEVKQTGVAVRYGKPMKYPKAYGVKFYYSRYDNTTVYAESLREAQEAAKGLSCR